MKIKTRSATVYDEKACTQLIYDTMGSMADYLLGGDDDAEAKKIISRLFQRQKNRYSHQYTELTIIDGNVTGLLLSYSGKILNSLVFPMAESMFAVNKLSETLRFFYRCLPLINIKEVEADEYFINNVAVFPKYQGDGVGKILMNLAEKRAEESGFTKCALTVEIENERAVDMYEHLGYQIVDSVKVERLKSRIGFSGLYRMVKVIDS